LAEQTSLKRKVALKLLSPDLAVNDRSLQRFKTEAENVARATHANIVQVYTIGQSNGVNYIALEYVEGKNLREFIEKKGTPELALGLHIMMQVAAALQRASELGIIHRDIKPENILLTKKGEVKVADFGLSRCFAESAEQTSLTQSQVTMGTPLYMSPEQVERKPVDPRTDIYAFGCTCYHMFAGQPPFRGNSPIDVAYQHVHGQPQPLSEIRPDLPADLFAIVQKMMAKKPEDRYQTANEIVRDINRLREALNLGAVAAVSISSSFIGGATTHTWAETPVRSRWPWRAILSACVVIALAGGLTLGWYRHHTNHVKDPLHNEIKPFDDGKGQSGKTKLDEQARKFLAQESLDANSKTQVNAGMTHLMGLGLFYLHEHRVDDADAFFADLTKPDRKSAYQNFGRLGHAVVLAFKDKYTASNEKFLKEVIPSIEINERRLKDKKLDDKLTEELAGHTTMWKVDYTVRELVAKALNRNWANDPKDFPEKLQPYRFPPKATLRAP
jgi:serine/threonine-protein kinase